MQIFQCHSVCCDLAYGERERAEKQALVIVKAATALFGFMSSLGLPRLPLKGAGSHLKGR